jgi:hypothetical protein
VPNSIQLRVTVVKNESEYQVEAPGSPSWVAAVRPIALIVGTGQKLAP